MFEATRDIRKGDVVRIGDNVEEVDDLLPFSQAIGALKRGAHLRRRGWNGKGMWIALQKPDAHSMNTLPYIYIEYPKGHPAYPDGSRVPWLASQTDLLSDDWKVAS